MRGVDLGAAFGAVIQDLDLLKQSTLDLEMASTRGGVEALAERLTCWESSVGNELKNLQCQLEEVAVVPDSCQDLASAVEGLRQRVFTVETCKKRKDIDALSPKFQEMTIRATQLHGLLAGLEERLGAPDVADPGCADIDMDCWSQRLGVLTLCRDSDCCYVELSGSGRR